MANTQTVVALDISAIIPMMIDIMMLGAVVAVMVPKPKQNLLTAGARTNLLASRMPAEMPKGNIMHAWMAQGGKGKTPWGAPRTNDAVSVTGRREGAPRSSAESRILRKNPDLTPGAKTDLIAAIGTLVWKAGLSLEKAKSNASNAHNHYIFMLTKKYKLTVWPPTSQLRKYPGLDLAKRRDDYLTGEADKIQVYIYSLMRDRTSAIEGGTLSHPYGWYFGDRPDGYQKVQRSKPGWL